MKLSLTTVCANKECDNILQTRYKSAFQEVATDATRQDMDKALKALQSSEQTLNLLLTSPPKSWEVRTTCYSYVSTAGFRYLTFSSHLVLLQTVARELRNIFENIIVLMRTTEKEANARILFVRLSSPQCYLSSTLFVCVMSSELIMVTQAIGRISEKLQRILGAGNDGNFTPTPMSIPIPTQTHTLPLSLSLSPTPTPLSLLFSPAQPAAQKCSSSSSCRSSSATSTTELNSPKKRCGRTSSTTYVLVTLFSCHGWH